MGECGVFGGGEYGGVEGKDGVFEGREYAGMEGKYGCLREGNTQGRGEG